MGTEVAPVPTTADVREAYQASADGLDFKSRYNQRGEEFDRWLREHDREVGVERSEAATRLREAIAQGKRWGVSAAEFPTDIDDVMAVVGESWD